MRHWIYCVAIVVLSACGWGCSMLPVREVKIPIPVPCVSQVPLRPESALDKLPAETPLFDAMRAFMDDRDRLRSHTDTLEALLEACK